MKKADSNGQASSEREAEPTRSFRAPLTGQVWEGAASEKPPVRRGTVAKVSHTLSVALAERLEEFAFYQRVSESAVIEFSLSAFFAQSTDDVKLGDQLRQGGAGRRRKSS